MMSYEDEEPQITILSGYLDLSRVGYLYRVAADGCDPLMPCSGYLVRR